MELNQGRTFHVHITIVFEWKMMAVIVSAHLIRLLMR
jgi:hypothetical protein